MEIGPGVDSAITVTSIISSCVIHFLFSTQLFSITEIIAYPPPKVNKPILANTKNSSLIFKNTKIPLPSPKIIAYSNGKVKKTAYPFAKIQINCYNGSSTKKGYTL